MTATLITWPWVKVLIHDYVRDKQMSKASLKCEALVKQELSEDNIVHRHRQPNLNSNTVNQCVWNVRLKFLSKDDDNKNVKDDADAMTIVLQIFMLRWTK